MSHMPYMNVQNERINCGVECDTDVIMYSSAAMPLAYSVVEDKNEALVYGRKK